MRYLLLFLLALGLAIIEENLAGVMLVFSFIASVALQFETRQSMIIAFWSGMASSMVNNSVLGRESLVFLITVGLIQVYRQRVAKHWIFMVVIVVIASLLNRVILGKEVVVKEITQDCIMALILLFFVREIRGKLFSDQIVVKI